MEKYFEIGQIVNTSGLKGVIKVKPFTDDITKFNTLKTIYIQIKDNLKEFEIEKVYFNKNMVFLKLKGIDTVEQAENYRNYYLKIERKEETLEENSYYIVDIEGCDVFTEEQRFLGRVIEVFSTGSNDVYVVKDETGKELYLPGIPDCIKKIDLENSKILVNLIKGLE